MIAGLEGILTPLLRHVQEHTNTENEDAWTGETSLEYVCTKLVEQVSFAAAVGGKHKADAQIQQPKSTQRTHIR
jgi:hypothetical protein